jgi:prepilin-type N-terminal cleavage/methylation domain-containing protein
VFFLTDACFYVFEMRIKMAGYEQKNLKAPAGFTLVELAIVMIIIGLLIGGVLKGQQLISNAQITAQIAQIKAVGTATNSFLEQYGDVPGDSASPTTLVTNCTVLPCSFVGNGDQKVNAAGAAIDFSAAPAGEQLAFWAQLNAAGYLIDLKPGVANTFWGGNFPESKVTGGGLDVGWYPGNACFPAQQGCLNAGTGVLGGTYLALHGTPGSAVGATAADGFMTPNQAMRIDTKIDDGVPGTGAVQSGGVAACINAGVYNESQSGTLCSLYIQFQN